MPTAANSGLDAAAGKTGLGLARFCKFRLAANCQRLMPPSPSRSKTRWRRHVGNRWQLHQTANVESVEKVPRTYFEELLIKQGDKKRRI
jgi:hypothetical protein